MTKLCAKVLQRPRRSPTANIQTYTALRGIKAVLRVLHASADEESSLLKKTIGRRAKSIFSGTCIRACTRVHTRAAMDTFTAPIPWITTGLEDIMKRKSSRRNMDAVDWKATKILQNVYSQQRTPRMNEFREMDLGSVGNG
mmetsp:Transcript_15010/g.23293  ORF Transcript_15010/g.23293 Transcript_15010/m.23293 type:complete len:141 (-) Transcript_15010:1205-1627(-)